MGELNIQSTLWGGYMEGKTLVKITVVVIATVIPFSAIKGLKAFSNLVIQDEVMIEARIVNQEKRDNGDPCEKPRIAENGDVFLCRLIDWGREEYRKGKFRPRYLLRIKFYKGAGGDPNIGDKVAPTARLVLFPGGTTKTEFPPFEFKWDF